LLDPSLEIAFVSACNSRLGLLVIYAFRRSDFPWVGNWEEQNNRAAAPWNGETFCRGLEFSSTPFAIPRRESIDQGPLFGQPTYRWLPAKSSVSVRFVIMLFRVPMDFGGVRRLSLERGRATITEAGAHRRQLHASIGNFLDSNKLRI
jgi:hypothetical protein